MQNIIERYFIVIIFLFSGVALLFPGFFVGLKNFIPFGLGFIMFGVGMNTSIASFKSLLVHPSDIAKLILRFVMMPLWAFMIAYGLQLTQTEMIGLLILGAAPGGTAANVMAYLSKSNVAFAVLLTLGSTILSPIVTPGIIYLLLHKTITIQFWPMAYHIATIVLLPVLGGVFFNSFKQNVVKKMKFYFPVISIFLVALLIACLFALNKQILSSFPWIILMAVILLNLLGYLTGWSIAYATNHDRKGMLATTFDYGMFDAVVAMFICTTFFNKETAIPAILISIIQNLTASMIVRYQKRNNGSSLACLE